MQTRASDSLTFPCGDTLRFASTACASTVRRRGADRRALVVVLLATLLACACGDDDDDEGFDASGGPSSGLDGGAGDGALLDATIGDGGASARAHDQRTFTLDAAILPFDPLPTSTVETDRWSGVLDGAGYRVEVPKSWNGMLVLYAHGYSGTVPALRLTNPPIRRHLIERGYAWAASTYSTNYYDVRAGVEDTNKLALAFNRIAAEQGRTLSEPTKRYLVGGSMGGHVTGAAIERETLQTALNKVRYDGAVPMCGVMGDLELFNYYGAYQYAAHALAGVPVPPLPIADVMGIRMQLVSALFTTYPTMTTPAGDKLKGVVMNLTGGARPLFDEGFAARAGQDAVWGSFWGDGTITGILARSVIDTRPIQYQFDADPALTPDEQTFNQTVARTSPEPEANPLRADGLRWIPQIHGEFDVPVVSIHTLGDMFVPFKMEQIYRQRAVAKGNGDRLVQRAIRGTGHCEFSYAEQVAAFEALVAWEQQGIKPEGDDVLDPQVVANPNYGCKFTNNTFTPEEMAGMLPGARAGVPACQR